MAWLSLLLYNALLPFALAFMLPGAFVKMKRRGGRWRDLGQRLGLWPQDRRAALRELSLAERYWVHAVSVGEVNVARKWITTLLRERPRASVILTTTTPTGHALAMEAEAASSGRLVVLYSPVDLPGIGSACLRRLQPRHIVLVEAEIWPNLLSAAQRHDVPVTLINARLSHRSAARYQKAKGLVAPLFQKLSQVQVQDPADIERWASIGVPTNRIILTGSIKYDPQGSAPAPEQVSALRHRLTQQALEGRPLLLAASTHDGEEIEIARIWQQLRQQAPALGLLLVPRHFERGPAVQLSLAAIGITAALRSQAPTPDEVLIIDTTGELKAWQSLASYVVIGKSFLAEGGQNPAEALMAGRPVICGPHMENFLPLMDLLLQADGITQVPDLPALQAALAAWLTHPETALTQAQRGKAALQAHDGATLRSLRALACMNTPA
jgi:3-deoxy-D-manno-octulosonic-acid transferase